MNKYEIIAIIVAYVIGFGYALEIDGDWREGKRFNIFGFIGWWLISPVLMLIHIGSNIWTITEDENKL